MIAGFLRMIAAQSASRRMPVMPRPRMRPGPRGGERGDRQDQPAAQRPGPWAKQGEAHAQSILRYSAGFQYSRAPAYGVGGTSPTLDVIACSGSPAAWR